MALIHFLNVLEGDCNIIQHDSGRVTVIDVSNAYDDNYTLYEREVKDSQLRRIMYERTHVPSGLKDYQQKKNPDNPIAYLNRLGVKDIFRFIITHPDMDHLDGIIDLFNNFNIINVWDTENTKEISDKAQSRGYNLEDWKYYQRLRDNEVNHAKRLTFYAGDSREYFKYDDLHILSPTRDILSTCNERNNWNDSSYVIWYTPPKKNGGFWKILFAGDSEDGAWESILKSHSDSINNIDILFAPHHGRDSGRSYDFLRVLTPKVTLFGNASSEHLAYNHYPQPRITNNQAGYVVLDISQDYIKIFVKNGKFARDFIHRVPIYNDTHEAYFLGQINA